MTIFFFGLHYRINVTFLGKENLYSVFLQKILTYVILLKRREKEWKKIK